MPPCEHPAHQYQNGERIGLERFGGAFFQRVEYVLGLQRRKQNARIAADDAQQRVVILALPVSGNGMEILPVLLIPEAEALPIEPLCFSFHCQEATFGALLHHGVKAIGHTVRQVRDKGVLLRQHRENLPRVPVACDALRHFNGKFISKSHDSEKLPLFFRKGIDHGGGKGGVDVRIAAG